MRFGPGDEFTDRRWDRVDGKKKWPLFFLFVLLCANGRRRRGAMWRRGTRKKTPLNAGNQLGERQTGFVVGSYFSKGAKTGVVVRCARSAGLAIPLNSNNNAMSKSLFRGQLQLQLAGVAYGTGSGRLIGNRVLSGSSRRSSDRHAANWPWYPKETCISRSVAIHRPLDDSPTLPFAGKSSDAEH